MTGCNGFFVLMLKDPMWNNNILDFLQYRGLWDIRNSLAPSITLGICLPYACAVDQLESSINRALQAKMSDMMVIIPENSCQYEEIASDWRAIDFATMYVLTVDSIFGLRR